MNYIRTVLAWKTTDFYGWMLPKGAVYGEIGGISFVYLGGAKTKSVPVWEYRFTDKDKYWYKTLYYEQHRQKINNMLHYYIRENHMAGSNIIESSPPHDIQGPNPFKGRLALKVDIPLSPTIDPFKKPLYTPEPKGGKLRRTGRGTSSKAAYKKASPSKRELKTKKCIYCGKPIWNDSMCCEACRSRYSRKRKDKYWG